MKFNLVNMLENATQTYIYQNIQGRLPTEQEIEQVVHQFMDVFKASEQDAQKVITSLQSRLIVSMDTGASVQTREHIPWLNSKKADIDFFFWERYAKYLEIDKNWSRSVIASIDDVTDRILDLLGDPTQPGPWKRRGLLLGDVQSGKTANYIAITNKAADTGYRVIILLSGIIENLRRQTQERLDEGFIGRSSKAALQKNQQTIRKGVGNIDPRKFAMAFTTEANDFKVNTVRSVNMSLTNTTQPVLFVIKKNTRSLENLISWLKTYNMDDDNGTIDLPLLLIDDEADNASVNTRQSADPTKINKLIRSLLKIFRSSSYIGVTATPFANIFIEPDTTDEMLDDDLFPRDFIYALSSPSNYIGSNAIFGESPKHDGALELITDGELYFPFGHNSELIVNDLPDSLKEALNYFILINAIRDQRGDRTAHRSMLINVSRLTAVQNRVASLVVEWFHVIKRDIQNYYKLSEAKALKNSSIGGLKAVYDEFDLQEHCSWNIIQKSLHRAAQAIEIRSVNQSSSSSNLDYEAHKDSGWRIVAIGGNSLSRGLTLEGLCVSYFYRNTQMYDTLMQMGRWFGYRPGYEDLFKIWMPQDAIDWYEHITEASNELRNEIRRMNKLDMTPADFGLRVRAHPQSLIVTARNKMRSAKTIEMWIALDGEFFETPRLISTMPVVNANQNVSQRLLNNLLVLKQPQKINNHKLWTGIPRELIMGFLKDYTNHPQNMESNPGALTDYIQKYNHLKEWDVLLPGGTGEQLANIKAFEHYAVPRKMDKGTGSMLRVSGTKLRVGTGGLTKFGLTTQQIKTAEREFRRRNDAKSVSDKGYLIEGRSPLLILYFIQPKFENPEHKPAFLTNKETLVAYGIGFPRTGESINGRYAKYVLNVVEQKNIGINDEEDDGDYDDLS